MTVASGQLPYEYDWPTPLRARNNADMGLSGVHLEAAQFVIQAEIRKFDPDGLLGDFTHFWRVRTNEAIAGSGYDPKPQGETLNGLVGGPVQVDLDHISLMRTLVAEILFEDMYSSIVEHDQVSILEDWIRQIYPDSPSGYHPGQGPNPQFRGQFLRPVLQEDGSEYTPSFSVARTGVFTDSDPHWLGGSGIILDFDVGEVMWNPYPLAFRDSVADVHGTASNWTIQIGACFPMFQRTNGSLISLNGLEQKWPQDPPPFWGSTLFLGFAAVGSGKLKYGTYGVFATTKFFMGALNTVAGDKHQIAFSASQPTVHALGTSAFGIESTQVFLNPIPLGTGLYRLAAQNRKSDKPFTTVESGVASQWPSDENFRTHNNGYEVFDNCFWVTDWGGKITPASTSAAGASGLVVVSPFTGRMLWQRNATDTVGGQVWDLSSSSLKDVRWWYNSTNTNTEPYLSLQRVGTDQIVRLVGAHEAGGVPGDEFDASVAIYEDDIATVTNQAFVLSLPPDMTATSFAVSLENMIFDGTDHWIGGDIGGEGSKTWRLNTSFVEQERYTGRIDGRAGFVSDGLGGSQKFVGFGGSDNITEYEIVASSNPDETSEIVSVVTKDLSPPTGQALVTDIYQIIEVTGITGITNGVYALILSRPALNTSRRLSIVRIEESVTTWEIRHEFILQTLGNTYNPDTRHIMGMIVMAVN